MCQYYENYMIDFRPYLIESPITVFTTDPILNCKQLMRNMYLRHIIVISPVDGSLQGIITRQDLFAWLDLWGVGNLLFGLKMLWLIKEVWGFILIINFFGAAVDLNLR